MKKIIPFLILLLYSISVVAQNASLDWVHQIGGNGHGSTKVISVDSSGDYIMFGTLRDTVDLLPGPGNLQYTSPHKWQENLIKYSASGNIVWHKQFSTDIRGFPLLDADKNIYLYGFFRNTVDFDPGPDTFNMNAGIHSKLFILKLDNEGNFKWVKSFYPYTNSGYVLIELLTSNATVDKYGNIYFAGSFSDSISFDTGAGSFSLHTDSAYFNNTFIVKFNSQGDFIWAHHLKGSTNLFAPSLLVDSKENLYVGGVLDALNNGTIDFDLGTGTYLFSVMNNPASVVVKYDSIGNLKFFNSLSLYLKLLNFDTENNLLLSGFANGLADVDPGPDTFDLVITKSYLTKWNEKGEFIWARNNYFGEICIDSFNNIYSIKINNDTFLNKYDLLLNYIDPNGNQVWTQTIATGHSSGYPSSPSIKLNSNCVYINLKLKSNPEFYLSSGAKIFDSLGNFNSYTFKVTNTSVGINEPIISHYNFKIYPNPTSGIFTIDEIKVETTITIYDITGKAISKKVINTSEKTELEIEGNPGIYFIEVLTEKGERQVFKIIKI